MPSARQLAPLLLLTTLTACKKSPTISETTPLYFEPQPHVLPLTLARPVIAAAPNGDIYLLGVARKSDTSSLTLTVSNDAGEHWSAPSILNAAATTITTSAENAPQLAARGMYAYALWQQHDVTGATTLQFARTSPGMAHMPPHVANIVDKPADDKSYSGFASFTLAPNGDVYAVWLDGRAPASSPGTFSVYMAKSTDKGMTFGPNVRVATTSCPCCRPAAAVAPDGTIYVVYRHVYDDNERDIALVSSHDGGKTFSQPVRVSTDRWKLLGCPESGPVIAVQNNQPIVSWYTASEQKSGIRLATSQDGGKTFAPATPISEGVLAANHPYLSQREDGSITVAFSGRSAAAQSGEWGTTIPYTYSIDSKGQPSRPAPLPNATAGSRYPTAALGPDGTAFITWTTEDDNPKTFLARATTR